MLFNGETFTLSSQDQKDLETVFDRTSVPHSDLHNLYMACSLAYEQRCVSELQVLDDFYEAYRVVGFTEQEAQEDAGYIGMQSRVPRIGFMKDQLGKIVGTIGNASPRRI